MDTQDRRHSGSPEGEIASVKDNKPVIDTFGVLVFIIVVVEIILVFGLNLYQKSRVDSLSQQLQEAKAALNLPENAALNVQISEVITGGDKLKSILSSKVRWSKFYTFLNAVTPKNVKLVGLTISDTGTFRAEGTTSSLSNLARLLVAWRDGTNTTPTPFTAVTLNSNSFTDSDGKRLVSFSVSGSVNMGALK